MLARILLQSDRNTVLQPRAPQLNGLAAHSSQLTGLEDIADTPLSPVEDIADTPKSPPPEDSALPASRPASAGVKRRQTCKMHTGLPGVLHSLACMPMSDEPRQQRSLLLSALQALRCRWV